MPWQRMVADVGGELDPKTGLPAYREIMVTVPRQSGKTILFVAWLIHRCLFWGRPQRTLYTAQTGKDARDKWLDELFPLIENSQLRPTIGDINRGMGNEALKWRNGSLIRILSTSAASGHSKTVDQAVLDEIWHDWDDRREQGIRPAMITRRDAQLLVCSTAGTAASTVYNRKVEMGRRAAAENSGSGVAYFEWSAPEDWDPTDWSSWWEFMPALGLTVSPGRISEELQAMDPAEFRRAYGNRPTGGRDMVIPAEAWAAVCDGAITAKGRLRLALDVAEDRASAAIAAADDAGRLELVEHRPGTNWIAARANELCKKYSTRIAFDAGGPAGVFAGHLERARPMKSRDVLVACASFYDRVMARSVQIRRHSSLDAAVEGVVKKQVGDLWAWSRRSSMADVTPLMAATLALATRSGGGSYLAEMKE